VRVVKVWEDSRLVAGIKPAGKNEQGQQRYLMTDRLKQIRNKPNGQPVLTQGKLTQGNPNQRRVYINQRILRIRDETKALQNELSDLRRAPAGDAPRDPKANHKKIYARERLIVLRDELKSLTAERQALPKKAAPPDK
jgi:hypothetical protein